MAMVGDLQDFSLPDLFQILERGSKSGQIAICTPSGIHRVWLYQGRVVAAKTPEGSLQQLLGDVLDEQIGSHIASIHPLQQPLGIYLKNRNWVAPTTLAKAFRQQLQVGVYPLVELKSGQFSFNANTPLPYEEMTGMSKGILDVGIEALRQSELSQQAAAQLPQPDSCFSRTSPELPLLTLSNLEWSIWDRIGPQHKLHEISQQLQADLLEVRKACARLMRAGLIQEILAAQHPSELAAVTQKSQVLPASPPARSVNPSLLNRLAVLLRGIR